MTGTQPFSGWKDSQVCQRSFNLYAHHTAFRCIRILTAFHWFRCCTAQSNQIIDYHRQPTTSLTLITENQILVECASLKFQEFQECDAVSRVFAHLNKVGAVPDPGSAVCLSRGHNSMPHIWCCDEITERQSVQVPAVSPCALFCSAEQRNEKNHVKKEKAALNTRGGGAER